MNKLKILHKIISDSVYCYTFIYYLILHTWSLVHVHHRILTDVCPFSTNYSLHYETALSLDTKGS